MKKLKWSLVSILVLIATPTLAQTATDWSGRYFGATLSFIDGTSNHSWVGTPKGVDVKVKGNAFGLTYGHNYAVQNFVLGYEVDISASNADGYVRGSTTPCVTPGEACSSKLQSYASVRVRAGIPVGQGFLPYLTGGLALGNVKASSDLGACGFTGKCKIDDWMSGYTVGVGVEKAFNNGWSAKLEYLHMDLGSKGMTGSAPGNDVAADFAYGMVRLGVNRRF